MSPVGPAALLTRLGDLSTCSQSVREGRTTERHRVQHAGYSLRAVRQSGSRRPLLHLSPPYSVRPLSLGVVSACIGSRRPPRSPRTMSSPPPAEHHHITSNPSTQPSSESSRQSVPVLRIFISICVWALPTAPSHAHVPVQVQVQVRAHVRLRARTSASSTGALFSSTLPCPVVPCGSPAARQMRRAPESEGQAGPCQGANVRRIFPCTSGWRILDGRLHPPTSLCLPTSKPG